MQWRAIWLQLSSNEFGIMMGDMTETEFRVKLYAAWGLKA